MKSIFCFEVAFAALAGTGPSGFQPLEQQRLDKLKDKVTAQLDSMLDTNGHWPETEKDFLRSFGLAAIAWIYGNRENKRFNKAIVDCASYLYDGYEMNKNPIGFYLDNFLSYSGAQFKAIETKEGLKLGFEAKDLHRLTTIPFYERTISNSYIHMCETCGTIFEPQRNDARHCSAICRRVAATERAKGGDNA